MATTILNFVVSPTRSYVGDTVTFYANASSDISTSLTFVIYFDIMLADHTNNTASPMFTTITGNPGNVVTTFAYDHVGNLSGGSGTYFVAKLYVSDGTDSRSATATVYVVENTAPEFTLSLPSGFDVSAEVEYSFTIAAMDVDNDPLTITWDFGDGTTPAVNLTGPAATAVEVTQTHTWFPYIEPGTNYSYDITFALNITVEDGQGNSVQSSTTIRIFVPENWAPASSFWTASTHVDPADEVLLQANATDHEGDPLTWTFVFSNETSAYNTTVFHTAPTEPETTVWLNITHVFGVEGNFTVTLWLTDALLPELQEFPHNLSSSLVFICAQNLVPYAMENITVSPALIFFNETVGFASAELSIQANDPNGDVLTITWDFGDGTESAVNVSGGGRQVYEFVQFHDYFEAGIYYASCTISDGMEGHELVRNGNVTVRSNNSAPTVRAIILALSNNNFAVPNSTVNLTLVLTDLERDPIEIWWDFGDNSSIVHTYISEFDSAGNGTSTVGHVYATLGSYMVRVWFTDSKFDSDWHNSSVSALVQVRAAYIPEIKVWDWWDTTSLGLLIGGVAAILAYGWYVRKFRTRLDQKGMTLEEHKILKNEQKQQLRAERKAKAHAAKAAKKGPRKGGRK